MSAPERRERTIRYVEFVAEAAEPWGALWTDVQAAINAAIRELRPADMPTNIHWEPTDDAIRVHVGDGEVIFRIEQEDRP